jgi:hypothetical protein
VRWNCSACFIGCWLSVHAATPANAAEPPLAPSEGRAAPSEAVGHYQRGVTLYDSGSYEGALEEFAAAYRLSANYQLLFNIAQLEYRLGHLARARAALERYSSEGGSAVAGARREQVQRQLLELAQRTTLIVLELDGSPTELELQGQQLVSRARRESFVVEPGHLQLLARRSGFAPIAREIDAAAGATLQLSLRFTRSDAPPPASSAPAPARVVVWSAAAALGLGAAGTGLATLLASRRYEQLRAHPTTGSTAAARERLDAQRALVRHLAITSDVLAAAGVASAAVGLYFTLHESDSTVGLQLGLGELFVAGAF